MLAVDDDIVGDHVGLSLMLHNSSNGSILFSKHAFGQRDAPSPPRSRSAKTRLSGVQEEKREESERTKIQSPRSQSVRPSPKAKQDPRSKIDTTHNAEPNAKARHKNEAKYATKGTKQ